MSDLKAQKRLAADVLDVGKNRVWFDPEAQGEIADAITREEIRDLVDQGIIQSKEARGNSRGRARDRQKKRAYGHRKGAGKRKGKAGARQDEKDEWKNQIRAQRRKLRELRDEGELDSTQYRELYNKARGGEFRSVRYMTNYIDNQYGDD
ncbi:50S ribosomal protein L19e [Halalkalicoccus sp. NIPERK01]|uniref:50S ribosomal protein L19e n=1 Tax=Halalkalicoccus sp. NIPERK01 TaxID=3053469 RepID=UPI00256F2859|nr:50S ribosomal protein L19e [Halalkalicoccus sp. NIPERK01]MDL5362532.1 50S ribosomal protein L19e [Halalkalicoccus sp. NIPERK01]